MDEVDASQSGASSPKFSGKGKLLGAVAGIVVVEALGIFIALKVFGGGPQASHAEGLAAAQSEPAGLLSSTEITVAQFRAPSEKTRQLFVYDLKVVALVKEGDRKRVEEIIEARQGMITDRLIRVVRRADPQQFREEDLSSLRRQIKYELDKLLEDGCHC